jgi:RNA polymerase sigma factor (sigma-70 family)
LHEKELIAGLKEGHEGAFAILVEIYKDRIYNTALGFLQNADDAEDLTQEVFIRVFENIRGFKGEAQLNTWLYRITVTSALDQIRKKNSRKRKSLFRRPAEEQLDFHHPGVAAEQKENAAILFRMIRRLPEQQQSAFLLQKLEGLSQEEIAAVLKTTVGAVESLLQRARINLKKYLEKEDKLFFK